MSPVPINFVGEQLCVPQNFWCRKKHYAKEGAREGGRERHDILSKICVSQCLKVRKGSVPCSTKNLVSKKLAIRGGASITIFRQSVLPHSTESFRRGILLCFKKFRALKNFRIKRGISLLFKEKFLPHRTKTFRMEPISVSINSVLENFHP